MASSRAAPRISLAPLPAGFPLSAGSAATIAAALLSGCGNGEFERTVASRFTDPVSVRFQRIEQRGSLTCGEVNGRGPDGAMTGYRRFVHDEARGATVIDDTSAPGPQDVAALERTCSMIGAEGNRLDRSVCDAARAAARRADAKRAFDAAWAARCSG